MPERTEEERLLRLRLKRLEERPQGDLGLGRALTRERGPPELRPEAPEGKG